MMVRQIRHVDRSVGNEKESSTWILSNARSQPFRYYGMSLSCGFRFTYCGNGRRSGSKMKNTVWA